MRDIALALFIFGTIPFILMRPYLGLLVWSWLGYMNPNRLCYGFAISFPWVQLVAIVTLLALLRSTDSKRIPKSTLSILLGVFLVWTGLTTIFAAVPVAAWAKWQEFAKVLVMVFMTLILVDRRERMHWLVWMVVVSLGFYGIKGGLFTVTHGGVSHVVGPPGSFIADNNALALALCMTLPLMRYLQLHSAKRLVRIGLGLGMLLTGIAILGTYSRGGLVALVIVAAALLWKSRRRLTILVAVVVVGSIAWHYMPAQWFARMDTLQDARQTSSGETRIQSWEFATSVAVHRPLRGGGFDVYQSDAMWQQYGPAGAESRAIHSIYFRTLGEQGFIGLGLYLALLFVSWRNCHKVRKRTRDLPDMKWASDLAAMLQVTLVGFMVAGAFLPMPYFDLTFQLMALSAVLLAYCVREIARQSAVQTSATMPATPVRSASGMLEGC